MNVFSRLFSRVTGTPQQRQIESGGGGRRWQNQATFSSGAQSILAAARPARGRAAALVMNNPLANRAQETLVSGLVGKGFQALSQHPDSATARALNAAFEEQTSTLLILAARCLVRDGECLIRISVRAGDLDGDRQAEFSPLVLPADQLDFSLTRDLGNGARIIAGVEFDATDRVAAYHILPDSPANPFAMIGAAVRIPAREIIHVFDRLFPGQVRGISWFSPVLLKLADFDAASDALLMSLKIQSLLTGFVRDAEGGTAGFESTDGTLNVSLEPGAMRVLPFGAEVQFSQPGQGLAQAADFLKSQQREIAVGMGVTFEQLTGDLSSTNYSSARVGLLEFRRRIEMLQKTIIEAQLLRPLWRAWIGNAADQDQGIFRKGTH